MSATTEAGCNVAREFAAIEADIDAKQTEIDATFARLVEVGAMQLSIEERERLVAALETQAERLFEQKEALLGQLEQKGYEFASEFTDGIIEASRSAAAPVVSEEGVVAALRAMDGPADRHQVARAAYEDCAASQRTAA